MEDKKKSFVIPYAEIIKFTNDDIITISDGTDTIAWNVDGGDADDFEE